MLGVFWSNYCSRTADADAHLPFFNLVFTFSKIECVHVQSREIRRVTCLISDRVSDSSNLARSDARLDVSDVNFEIGFHSLGRALCMCTCAFCHCTICVRGLHGCVQMWVDMCACVCQAICAPQCCTQVPFKICRQTLAPAVDIVWAQSYKSAGSDVFPFALNRTYTRTHEQTQTLHARSYTLTRNALQNTSQNTALRTSYVPCVATLDEERDCILHHYI